MPTTGVIPAGLPTLQGPELRLRDVEGIFPLAAGCLLLAYIESISAARTFAAKHGYAVDARQEFLGLGAANLAAAMGQSYPVAGGLSQSAVNDKAGARTPLALLVASAALALCLLFLTGLLENLPKAVLAAVVVTAVLGLLDIPGATADATCQPTRLLCCYHCTCRRVVSWDPTRDFARGACLSLVAAIPCLASARRVPRPCSRHDSLLRPRASSRKSTAQGRCGIPS